MSNFDAMPPTPPQEVPPRKSQPFEVGCARSSRGMPPGLCPAGPLQELGHTHFEIRCSSQCWRLTGCDPAEPRSPGLRVWPQSSCDLAMVSLDPLVRNSHLGDVRPAEGRYFTHSAERGEGSDYRGIDFPLPRPGARFGHELEQVGPSELSLSRGIRCRLGNSP